VLPRDAEDLTLLQRNLDELESCDAAVFLVDQERTGTGIELGYLYQLAVAKRSRAALIGFSRTGDIDLMARFCLSKLGTVVSSIEGVVEAVRSRALASDV
jgi:hypothetical protein